MKRIYVREEWCIGCHLCEYYCAFANSGERDMSDALRGVKINPRIQVEDADGGVTYAISCRHCERPRCVEGCITGALTVEDGVIRLDEEKCVGCYTCIMLCPYGAINPSDAGKSGRSRPIQKCELCLNNANGEPACAAHCPNRAIIFEEGGSPCGL
ncbi:MAG: 4Fe-4S binding protein [Oscillospiraceae bacterium]|jgi:carbon-monoxide dehydrogenase iron sulfur subunit|nr:4Fe-4S binding protein [Oscillospiraceae bacterium]